MLNIFMRSVSASVPRSVNKLHSTCLCSVTPIAAHSELRCHTAGFDVTYRPITFRLFCMSLVHLALNNHVSLKVEKMHEEGDGYAFFLQPNFKPNPNPNPNPTLTLTH